MKILITGNQGYVGPVLIEHLRAKMPDAHLVGFDSGFFGHALINATYLPERLLDAQRFGDVRDLAAEDLAGFDAIVHLAAVSNDPMGKRFETVTEAINCNESVRLAKLASAAGVGRFVFASSCSVYGFAPGDARRESDPLNPQTAYARSKVDTEKWLAEADLGDMTVTCLRFATACGMSPRLRLDLVLNDFVASAIATGEVKVLSDGTPWRPLIDVRDMARAIEFALVRPVDAGGPLLSVNAGSEEWNYQIKDLAHAVAAEIPGTSVSINTEAQPDTRSYKVDFALYRSLALDHQPQVTLQQSIRRLFDGLSGVGFHDKDFRASNMMRLKLLESHIAAERLSENLRWRDRTTV